MNLAQIELNSEQKFHFVTLCGGVFLPCVVIKMSCSLMLSADSIKGKKELRSTMNYVHRKASDDDASTKENTIS